MGPVPGRRRSFPLDRKTTMTMPDTHRQPLVADYLDRLDEAALRLPPDQRSELIDGIREHLDSALAGVDSTNEAQVRAVLDRLGAPDEIVAAAVEGEPRSEEHTSELQSL